MTQQIWLLNYPVQLGLSLAEHVEESIREFKLIAFGQQTGVARQDVPDRLQQTVQHIRQRYASELSGPDRLRLEAAARGDATVDLPYPAPPEAEQVIRGWQRLLADVDEYCRTEKLLTLHRTPPPGRTHRLGVRGVPPPTQRRTPPALARHR